MWFSRKPGGCPVCLVYSTVSLIINKILNLVRWDLGDFEIRFLVKEIQLQMYITLIESILKIGSGGTGKRSFGI